MKIWKYFLYLHGSITQALRTAIATGFYVAGVSREVMEKELKKSQNSTY